MTLISNQVVWHRQDEVRMTLIVVRDDTKHTTSFSLASTILVKTLFEYVACSHEYSNGMFTLTLELTPATRNVRLNDYMEKSLEAVGFTCDNGVTKNYLVVNNIPSEPPPRKMSPELDNQETVETDNTRLAICASGSLNVGDQGNHSNKQGIGFSGLVNQAMTCYLNSLIQTLYMTPEFRNALYRWRFDGNVGEQAKSIPFQLQRLFLKLQTTDEPSIGTTNLTRSFGWDSSEAWQQHDIQELCRVMFDALEHKFKNTDQSDLISRLYEGKMMDYVRCLKCSTEKAREDTFLDIPLPVRPFGSQTAYASIDEALKAFVSPETLDDNNQYWCDKCQQKCDAHKGLKFSRFPYLLTLHLKRFDFDYNTLHRIKLNDKVTFPEILNLDSFIEDEPPLKCSSTPDANLEDSISEASEFSRANSSNENESQDDDEGIDVRTEGCTSSTSCASGDSLMKAADEDGKNRTGQNGGLNYELFSIMIHSGSASGGHYYAYIKDFVSRQWFCFNDQTVSSITYDDIRKTYGGGPSRSAGYFTSAYTSSTNAYMLMYREINQVNNASFMNPSEFPEHLQRLLERMKEDDENQKIVDEKEKNTCSIQLYCHHPKRGRIDVPLKLHRDVTLREAISQAHGEIGDLQDVPLERCRLVKYNEFYDSIDCSWDDRLDETIYDVFDGIRSSYKFDLLLEMIGEGQQFQQFTPGSLAVKVFFVDVDTKELRTPVTVRMPANSTVGDLKLSIRGTMSIDAGLNEMYMVLIRYSNELRPMLEDDRTLRKEGFLRSDKVYVTTSSSDVETFNHTCQDRFFDLINQFENCVTVRLTLPKSDKETLERLGINYTQDCCMLGAVRCSSPVESCSPDAVSEDSLSHLERERALSEGEDEDNIEELPPSAYAEGDVEEVSKALPNSVSSTSASEDGSLSLTDSDRTILGDTRESAEFDDASSRRRSAVVQAEPIKYFFKVMENLEEGRERCCSVLIDKRMPLSDFKLELEMLLNVSSESLLVYKRNTTTTTSSFGASEREWVLPNETLENLGDDPQIVVRLGRALRPGEVRGKIHQLCLNDPHERSKFLFEWVLTPDVQIGHIKKNILAEMKSRYAIDIPYEKCILRKKIWRTPSTVYGEDEETIDTSLPYLSKNWEMYLQVLDLNNPEAVALNYRDADTTIFARRWRPSSYTLEELVDIPLTAISQLELGEKLTKISQLPVDSIEIAKAPGTFPCEGSVLNIHDDITWIALSSEDASTDFKWPCCIQNDGDIVYWRHKAEPLKKLTEEERKEILKRENGGDSVAVDAAYPATVSSSPRKERPLRIFLDTPSSTKVKEEAQLD